VQIDCKRYKREAHAPVFLLHYLDPFHNDAAYCIGSDKERNPLKQEVILDKVVIDQNDVHHKMENGQQLIHFHSSSK
jgi:hypothetical protein